MMFWYADVPIGSSAVLTNNLVPYLFMRHKELMPLAFEKLRMYLSQNMQENIFPM